jgi:hypothetical protein
VLTRLEIEVDWLDAIAAERLAMSLVADRRVGRQQRSSDSTS